MLLHQRLPAGPQPVVVFDGVIDRSADIDMAAFGSTVDPAASQRLAQVLFQFRRS